MPMPSPFAGCGARAGHFLRIERLLDQRGALPTILLGPVDPYPAAVIELALPDPSIGKLGILVFRGGSCGRFASSQVRSVCRYCSSSGENLRSMRPSYTRRDVQEPSASSLSIEVERGKP